ncbi:MAG: DeoR/GlpR family DNA-binding transcription regulator [Treponema sp.]|jgi:DeoR/GlpR family transcriptional regulator of sugar metabolism|nr:DeoR/GlpR family DNA-binding transcription regulator [Treponema sp.]
MTDKQSERQKLILEIITREGPVEVAALAEKTAVSRVTLRKDLDMLEKKGLLRHEKGQAFPGSSDDMNSRLSYHYDTKKRIARAAAALVGDGEAVMIESGSCCAILAEELAHTKRDVRIITNSAFIAGYIRTLPRTKIVLLGGDYQNEAQVMVGPITRLCAQGFTVDKLFIGADGFSESAGFTGKDHLRAEAVRDMAKQAAQVIVLTESEKFGKQGLTPLLPPGGIGAVITDSAIPPDREAFLTGRHIRVYKVGK